MINSEIYNVKIFVTLQNKEKNLFQGAKIVIKLLE